MPLVRIDLNSTALRKLRQTVSDVVYDAMITVAKVPADDKFQIVTGHAADELVYPKEGYLGTDYTRWHHLHPGDVERRAQHRGEESILSQDRRRSSLQGRRAQAGRLYQSRRCLARELVLRQRRDAVRTKAVAAASPQTLGKPGLSNRRNDI